MFEAQMWAKDTLGSLQAILTNPQGYLVAAPTAESGVARTTNPTAVADTVQVPASFDDLGRQLIRPYQVRDLISTGYTTLTRATETTVLSAVAGVSLDLVSLTASNSSSIAQVVDIRAVTAGNIEFTLVIPIGSTIIKDFLIPRQQANTGNNWTAQVSTGGEISDSPVTVSMTASREI